LALIAVALPAKAQESQVEAAVAEEPSAVYPDAPQAPPTPAPPLIPGPPAHVRPDDKRRTVRSYLHNLAYDFVAVVQHDNHKPLFISAAATLPAFAFDHDVEDYFANNPHEHFGDLGAKLGGGVAMVGLTVGLFSAGRISTGDNFRAMSYDVSQAVIITQVYTLALKLATQRERPDGSDNFSFPSGHASNAFAIASVVARHYKKLAIPAYAFGTFVAVSRLAAEKHHLSDIVAGSGLGLSIGRVVVRRNDRPPDPPKPENATPPPKSTWTLAPWAGPSHDGRGLTLVVTF
jgi:membrane-associated phospholipid phosphatase